MDILKDSPWVIPDASVYKGNWRDTLKGKKLNLEIGCGKGKYITEMAAAHPEEGFIGDERVSTILARAALKVEDAAEKTGEPYANLRLIRVSAEELRDVFAPGEIDRIFLTFSDPWPKEKHAKRRLTSDRFLPIYETLLSEEGDLCFKTDNDALFAYSIKSLEEGGWKILEMTDDLHGSDREKLAENNPGVLVTTEYEENFIRIGKNIHYLRAVPGRIKA